MTNDGTDVDEWRLRVTAYKACIESGEIPSTYERLIKLVMRLRVEFEKQLPAGWSVGNVSPGYLDFTYFPFFSQSLRAQKLRFGVVLNHQRLRFELWLMAQNRPEQVRWWELLKATRWNGSVAQMPRYSVLEVPLTAPDDFLDRDALVEKVYRAAWKETELILAHLDGPETQSRPAG